MVAAGPSLGLPAGTLASAGRVSSEVVALARILVIDDEPGVRDNLARALEGAGYYVSMAANGQEALRLLEADSFDLVITDILMPMMDGLKLIRALAELRPGLPIIAVSGGGALPKQWLLYDAEDLGVVEAIAKPFDLGVMLGAVARAVRPRGAEGPGD